MDVTEIYCLVRACVLLFGKGENIVWFVRVCSTRSRERQEGTSGCDFVFQVRKSAKKMRKQSPCCVLLVHVGARERVAGGACFSNSPGL